MVDTPEPSSDTDRSPYDLEGPGAIPLSAHPAEPHHSHEETKGHTDPAEDVMRTLKTIGRGIRNTINWVDSKGPFISAVSTVAIAVLTAFYVHYSRVANGISLDTLQSVQRPFIVFKNISPLFMTGDKGAPLVALTADLTNEGNTPAVNALSAFNVQNLPHEPNEVEFIGNRIVSAGQTIGPKTPFSVGPAMKDPNQVGIIGPPGHDSNLFFWGWTTYNDVFFPNTKKHLTEFCAKHIFTVTDQKKQPVALNMAGCSQHNCTDEYCADYAQIIALNP